MEMKNFTESLVREKMEELLKGQDMCKCEKCQNDIFALTLNNLPPRYVSTETGELYKKVYSGSVQQKIDTEVAVSIAINTIKKSPNHDQ